MRRRRVRQRAKGLLWRTVEVRSVGPYVSIHPMTGRGEEPRNECGSWLDVQGYLDSPVKGVFDVTIPRSTPIAAEGFR